MDDDQWSLIGYIISSKYRRKILFYLKAQFATPKQISSATDISINHVSNILISLKKMNLVLCKNPDAKRGRIYILTERAGRLLELISNISHE